MNTAAVWGKAYRPDLTGSSFQTRSDDKMAAAGAGAAERALQSTLSQKFHRKEIHRMSSLRSLLKDFQPQPQKTALPVN